MPTVVKQAGRPSVDPIQVTSESTAQQVDNTLRKHQTATNFYNQYTEYNSNNRKSLTLPLYQHCLIIILKICYIPPAKQSWKIELNLQNLPSRVQFSSVTEFVSLSLIIKIIMAMLTVTNSNYEETLQFLAVQWQWCCLNFWQKNSEVW